jgi:AhpC/TSA antioxidant enzyme
LRHSGCTFCREALSAIAASRARAEEAGIRIVLVHMGDWAGMSHLLEKYNLTGIGCISDPEQKLYRVFGLRRGRIGQLLGPKVWWRAIQAGILNGHGVGRPTADAAQMPGMFLLKQLEVVGSFRHGSKADRPDCLSICAPHIPL